MKKTTIYGTMILIFFLGTVTALSLRNVDNLGETVIDISSNRERTLIQNITIDRNTYVDVWEYSFCRIYTEKITHTIKSETGITP